MIELAVVRRLKRRQRVDSLAGRDEGHNPVALLGALVSIVALAATTSVGPYLTDLVRNVLHGLGQA